MGQQAFNSCMILLLDAMELGRLTSGVEKVEKAFVIFQELQDVHKLASLAVERISWGMKELHDVTQAPAGSLRPRRSHSGDTKMQGAWSEATQAPLAMRADTVMNATGMLLLEDPGLQGFVPEAFAPIAWNLGGDGSSMQYQFKHERDILGTENTAHAGHLESPGSDGDLDDYRSAGVMQGMRRSTTMRSAPTRYATPATDDLQPPGVTAPTSRTSLAGPTQQHQYHISMTENSQPIDHPPHLQHAHSSGENNRKWKYHPVATAADTTPSYHRTRDSGLNHGSLAQMRHNSCSAIPQPAPALPLSRPSYSPSNTPTAQASKATTQPPRRPSVISDQASFQDFLDTTPHSISPAASPSVHPSWAARPAGRPGSLQVSDATSNFSQPSRIDQGYESSLPYDMAHGGQQTASSYPMHFSDATLMTMPSTAEQFAADEWRRWMSGSGAG